MKATRILCVVWLALASPASVNHTAAAQTTNTIHLKSFTLRDQHDQEHKLTFPQPRVFVLTVADRKGSEQIEPWIRPLKERYGENLLVEGIADVSAVPKLLRSTVRNRFKKASLPPVMLDWEGQITPKLNLTPDAVNLFVVATNGLVIFATNGPANEKKLEHLYKILNEYMPRDVLTNPPAVTPIKREVNGANPPPHLFQLAVPRRRSQLDF